MTDLPSVSSLFSKIQWGQLLCGTYLLPGNLFMRCGLILLCCDGYTCDCTCVSAHVCLTWWLTICGSHHPNLHQSLRIQLLCTAHQHRWVPSLPWKRLYCHFPKAVFQLSCDYTHIYNIQFAKFGWWSLVVYCLLSFGHSNANMLCTMWTVSKMFLACSSLTVASEWRSLIQNGVHCCLETIG